MNFREWFQNIFLNDPELVTKKRSIKWARLGVALGIAAFSIMIGVAVFGNSTVKPDDDNYQPLSAEDVSKKGVVVLSTGNYEVRKKPSGERNITSSPRPLAADQAQVISRKDRAHSEYVIPSGSKVSVFLEGDLNSELAQSPVVAEVREPFSFQGRLLIPARSKILGHAAEGQNSERIAVQFDQIVYPNGYQIAASGLAMMSDGSPGIVGELHSNRGAKIAGALGTSFLAGSAAAFETTVPNSFGIQQPTGSTQNAILNGLAQSSLDQAKRFGEEAQQTKGYVTLGTGSQFYVYFEKEVDLSAVLE